MLGGFRDDSEERDDGFFGPSGRLSDDDEVRRRRAPGNSQCLFDLWPFDFLSLLRLAYILVDSDVLFT